MFQYLALRGEVQGKTVRLRKTFQLFFICRGKRRRMAQYHQRAVIRLHQLNLAKLTHRFQFAKTFTYRRQ